MYSTTDASPAAARAPAAFGRALAGLREAGARGRGVLRAQRYEVRAHLAMFLERRDGLIRRQRNHDCFEPF